GRRLAKLLISQIETPGAACKTELLEAELTVGSSTGPVPNRM
ncbi:LacI family transcriptional regulator, partial [Phaeobacter sp. HF9A]|nr:LacI family transcriptional regulator [Phaeobacter sp. HF9A]